MKILRQAGVKVQEDFMKEECDKLNPVFFHYITKKTPYVVMKYAMTIDGKIATKTGDSRWITGEKAREAVHEMRHSYMGIMAGIGTVLADDPMLNVRLEGRKSPVRIICDSHLRIPGDSRIVKTAQKYKTIIACGGQGQEEKEKMERLCKAGIQVISIPDNQGRVDLKVFLGPKIFGGVNAKGPVEGIGIESVGKAANMKLKDISKIGDDVLLEYVFSEAI